jgi:pyruvate formate lyase activating enzyme
VHTALDTSGFASRDALLSVIDYTDMVLFDLKHLNRDRHLTTIGVDNEIILANLKECSNRTRIWTRTPLIPGFNDDAETMDAIVDLARKVGAERCCFLPLHRWGEHKYSRLGLANPYENMGELSPGNIARWKERYRCEQFVSF